MSSAFLIDTHCHLNDAEAYPDVQAELDFAKSQGVERLLVVATQPSQWESTLQLAQQFEEIYAILGWHPNYTAEYDLPALNKLEELAADARCAAVGEIGLDYHWNYASKEQQFKALHDQLDLAEKLDLPVVFHAREAYSDLLDVLEKRPRRPYLLHCFAGDGVDAKRAIALDCYFGVDGPITYKNAEELRETVRTLPRNRLVVETDAPYLTPVPYRGKPNRPGFVKEVNLGLAACIEISEEECAALTTANALRFFKLKG